MSTDPYYDPMRDVQRLINKRRLTGGAPVRLTGMRELEGYLVAHGPGDGQVTIRLTIFGDRDLIVDAAKIEHLPTTSTRR